MRKQIVLAILLTLLTTASFAQVGGAKDSPRPQPRAISAGARHQDDYSSPRMKGRKIYGGLVPFGAVWRTGANEATTFVATTDVKVHDRLVPRAATRCLPCPMATSGL